MTQPEPPAAAADDDGADAGRPRKSQAGLAFALLGLGLVVPAVAIAFAYRSCGEGTARGQIVVAGSPLGSWRAPVMKCALQPGNPAEVTLIKDADTTLARISYQGTTPIVELHELSGNRTIRLDPTSCAGLTMKATRAPTPTGTTDLRSGSLFADCTLASGGGKITIDAWWQRCSEGE